MDSTPPPTPAARGWRRHGKAAALVASGLVTGGLLAGTLTANAADTGPSPSSGSSSSAQTDRDESRSQRSDEQLLTGETADKVRAAVLAKYPGATVQRVESDSDGVYEAHLVTADGGRLTAEVDRSFAVTGEEQGGRGHGRGHHHDDDEDTDDD